MKTNFEAQQYRQKVKACENCRATKGLDVVEFTENHLHPDERFVVFCSACLQMYRRMERKAKKPDKSHRSIDEIFDEL